MVKAAETLHVQVAPAFVDFEMTGLSANYGRLICGCIKPYGGEVTTLRIDDTARGVTYPWDDHDLALGLRDELEKQWMIVGWNSVMFDIKFLNSRLMFHRERVLRKPLHKDLLFTAKTVFALTDNRLITVQEHLQLDEAKTRLDPNEWIKASAGDAGAIDYVAEHCVQDVRVLEEVFEHLVPFIKEIHRDG